MRQAYRGKPLPPPAKQRGRNQRGALTFASLNIKGGGFMSTRQKWNKLCQIMKGNVDILAVQETHLDMKKMEELNDLFKRQAHFISSLDPDKSNVKGVAFVISKQLVNWKGIRHREMVPGRALVIEIPWHEGSTLSCLNVYALNDPMTQGKTKNSER